MKKETINTFNKGMIKDTHPLTTPNDVLTDTLNGTYITYNGNEMILQNDMGNAKLKHAKLPDGYVPVGMKEHGGIIYVAAYDPQNKVGQIGCFPSPLQLWEGQNWTVNAPDNIILDASLANDFYDGCIITKESVKILLFTCGDNKPPRKLYPGDKFAIQGKQLGELINMAESGDLILLLGVIRKDGGIDIMYNYKDHNFICNGAPDDVVQSSDAQVFTASSSGNLILIATLVTLDSFNIFRKYTLNENDLILVTFLGSGTRDGLTIPCDGIKLGISDGSCTAEEEIVDTEINKNTKNFTLYPALPYGLIGRMKRSFTIDYNKIRKSEDDFHEWRFFVTDKYIKIGWAYEYYNLDETKNINLIIMKFYDLWESDPSDARSGSNPVDVLYIKKDYYSGNFEDYLRFDKHAKVKKKHIYIVRIEKEVLVGNGTETSVISWQMLYVSPLYNSMYNGLYDDIDPEDGEVPDIVQFDRSKLVVLDATLDFTLDIQYELKGQTVKVFHPGKVPDNTLQYESVEAIDIGNINKDYYIMQNPVTGYSAEESSNQFITEVCNEYEATITINGVINYNDNIIGCPDPNLINNVLTKYSTDIKTTITSTVNKNLEWKKSGNILGLQSNNFLEENKFEFDPSAIETKVEDNTLTISKLKIKDYRYILGRSSDIKNTPYETEGLAPLYSLSLSNEDKRRIFTAWNMNELRVVCGDGENSFRYNAIFNESGSINPEGTSTGSGHDDSALDDAVRLMNETSKPMVTMFIPETADYGTLWYSPMLMSNAFDYKRWGDIYTAPTYGKHWMCAVWKFEDGKSRFVNLLSFGDFTASNINFTDRINSPEMCTRLDIKLRCFLSQIFIPQKVTLTAKYVTPNGSYRYLEGNTSLSLKLKTNTLDDLNFNDIMWDDSTNPTKSITLWLADWGIVSIDQQTNTYSETGFINMPPLPYLNSSDTNAKFNNLVPILKISNKPELEQTFDVDIESEFNIDVLLNYYLGVTMSGSAILNNSIDIQKWYVVDVNALENGFTPNINYDGTITWETTPPLKICDDLGTGTTKTTLFDWKGNKNWKFADLKNQFTTTAAKESWNSILENNELLAKYFHGGYGKIAGHLNEGDYVGETSDTNSHNVRRSGEGGLDSIHGYWDKSKSTNGHAPDLYFNILLSNKSLYNGDRGIEATGDGESVYGSATTNNKITF